MWRARCEIICTRMIGIMSVFVCTVLAVKSFSGCYPSCPNCRRKLKELKVGAKSERYWCRRCQLQCLHEEVVHRYCVGVTATNHTICADVVVFGGSLNSVFGASASEFHRWLIELESYRDLEFGETFSYLLQRSLETVFVGKCFAFTFQNHDPLETRSKHSLTHYGTNRLIATSVKPLGSINNSTDVITILKYHFNKREPVETHLGGAPPSSIQSTTPTQSVAIPCCNTYTTVFSSQEKSTSFLYESMPVSESHVPQFESYCDPSTNYSLSTLSLESSRALHPTDMQQTECSEHSVISSEAVDLEILQELISDWQCSQNVQENSTSSSDTDRLLGAPGLDSFSYDTSARGNSECGCHQQPDVSLSNFSEAIIAELQSSFNRSVCPTPCGNAKQTCSSSINTSATPCAPLTSLHSTPCNSPELFSSTSSLNPAASTSTCSNRKLTSKRPPLHPLTWVSPEMFDNSELSLQTTPFHKSSRSHCNSSVLPDHYFTPAVDKHNLSLPRRNILCNISNKLPAGINTQQAVTVELASRTYLLDSLPNSPQMKDRARLYTAPSGQLDNHSATFSPDLFTQT